jgi:granzyme K
MALGNYLQLVAKYLPIFLFQGDSGGPLICKGIFHALVSQGYKCGIAKKPGIYTLLTKKYQTWIKSKLAPSRAH